MMAIFPLDPDLFGASSLAMVRARSTGMEVNKDLTSKETMTSSQYVAGCFEKR